MNTKKFQSQLYLLVVLTGILAITFGCEKVMFWKDEVPSVTTLPVTDISVQPESNFYSATASGEVTEDGGVKRDTPRCDLVYPGRPWCCSAG